MLVHSFSEADTSFRDFQAFSEIMGMPVGEVNQITDECEGEGVRLRLAWVKDKPIK